MNLKKLQSSARRRLNLHGEVEFVKINRGARAEGRIVASSVPVVGGMMKHRVSYSDASSLDVADVYHELCRAKLYELGFNTIENAGLVALKECSKDDPKYILDANSSVVLVSEVYTSYLLYTFFAEESEARRREIVLRFESSDALTNLHTQMGFWGVGGIAYYKIASEWAGKDFPTKQVDAAISRASDGKAISEELSKIEPILRELPRVDPKSENQLTENAMQVLYVIQNLFSAKTGLNCE